MDEPRIETCDGCGFVWAISIEEAILDVSEASDRYAALLGDGPQKRSVDDSAWSAVGYLWHVVDVIRYGTERLWTLTLDPVAGVPGWDQEAMAAARGYEQLSVPVGVRALRVAIRDWVEAARKAPPEATVEHPSLGTLTTRDSILRNAHEVRHHEHDIEAALGM